MPRIAYDITIWSRVITPSVALRQLYPLQRRALLGITLAYRTVSTEALQLIADVMPIDLELQLLVTKSRVSTLPPDERFRALTLAGEDALDKWQSRWDLSTKGRWTYKCLPSVRTRLKTPIWLCHETVQLLSGHGNFRAKLHSFSLRPPPTASAGMNKKHQSMYSFTAPYMRYSEST